MTTPATQPLIGSSQQAVVQAALEGRSLVVHGGPGSGKTATMVAVVAALLERDRQAEGGRGLNHPPVWAIAANQRLAHQANQALVRSSGQVLAGPVVRTLHSLALEAVNRARQQVGLAVVKPMDAQQYDRLVRQLLRGDAQGATRCPWPSAMSAALGTQGFAQQVRDVLTQCSQRGVSPAQLEQAGRDQQRPVWVALGRFAQECEQVRALATPDLYPLAQIVPLVVRTWQEHPQAVAALHQHLKAVVVDDVQALDPAGVSVVAMLASAGFPVIGFADADQAVEAFRGVSGTNVAQVSELLAQASAGSVPVVQLEGSYRLGAEAWRQARQLVGQRPSVGGEQGGSTAPTESQQSLRGQARLQVEICRSEAAQLEVVVQHLHHHHAQGVPWEQMAVVGRRRADLVPVRRALAAAGVPVSPGQPLSPPLGHPLVQVVLLVVRLACRLAGLMRAGSGSAQPGQELSPSSSQVREAVGQVLNEQQAHDLLTSQLVGADALVLRRLHLTLLDLPGQPGQQPAGLVEVIAQAINWQWVSGELAHHGLAEGNDTAGNDTAEGNAGERVQLRRFELPGCVQQWAASVVRSARLVAGGGQADEVVWQVWSCSPIAARLARQLEVGSAAAARASGGAASAEQALDAIAEMRDAATDFLDSHPQAGVQDFLDDVDGLRLPVFTNARRMRTRQAVALVTAHGCVGRAWQVVHVLGTQEGNWPDHSSGVGVLDQQWLFMVAHGAGASGGRGQMAGAGLPTQAAALAQWRAAHGQQQRRLFYLAITRASRHTLVSAVHHEGQQQHPGRFVEELLASQQAQQADEDGGQWPALEAGGGPSVGEPAIEQPAIEQPAWVNPSVVVAGARHHLVHLLAQPQPPCAQIQQVARLVARLARDGVNGAHPDQWYAAWPRTDALPAPTKTPAVVTVSPSAVETFQRCPLRWLAESVGAKGPSHLSAWMGSAVHHVAAVAEQLRANGSDGEQQLRTMVEQVIAQAPVGAGWAAAQRREHLSTMLARLLGWLNSRPSGTTVVGTELAFSVQVGTAQLRGRMDRVERDGQGNIVVIDVKTGASSVTAKEMEHHPQLGMYQLAVCEGGLGELGPQEESTVTSAAMLVQVGKAAGEAPTAKQQEQPSLDASPDPRWPYRLLEQTAAGMVAGSFPALLNSGCRTCPVRVWCPAQPEGQMVGQAA